LTITGLLDVQFETEAQHLKRLKHPNIVQLVGYCSETKMKLVRHNGTFVRAEQPERLLCLEYMPKGSLRGHLSGTTIHPLFYFFPSFMYELRIACSYIGAYIVPTQILSRKHVLYLVIIFLMLFYKYR
jgi:serine/threonine protein kinase